jgi:hypothetical protein
LIFIIFSNLSFIIYEARVPTTSYTTPFIEVKGDIKIKALTFNYEDKKVA